MAAPSLNSTGVNNADLPMKNWAACSLNMRVAGFLGLTMTTISANAGTLAAPKAAASSILLMVFFMLLSLEYEVDAGGIYIDRTIKAWLRVQEGARAVLRLDMVDLHFQ